MTSAPAGDRRASSARTPTRTYIVQAAQRCFRRFGVHKTTMTDISREAGVSRATLYQYFKDKTDVMAATAEDASREFYVAMGEYMAEGETFEEQIGLAVVFLVASKAAMADSSQGIDDDEIGMLLTVYSEMLMRECVLFLKPYLESAKESGEIRSDLNLDLAAEWIARILFSMYVTPSVVVDLNDHDAVYDFVTEHLVRGLEPRRSMRTRPPALQAVRNVAELAVYPEGRRL